MNIGDKDIIALRTKQKVMYCKAEIIDTDYKTIMMLEGNITSGNYSVNSDSDIRRTCNITMCLKNNKLVLSEDIFFNHYVRIYIGYYSYTTKEILYYSIGIYSFDKESFRYDISSNEVSFTLLDLCSLMDNNHYGADYGAETSVIYAVDPETGERYSKTDIDRVILKNIVNGLLDDFAKNNTYKDGKSKISFKHRRIDDIGMNDRNGTNEYAWNELPYDLEFSSDNVLIDKLRAIRDLYGIHEFFWDVSGVFVFQEIPHMDYDIAVLTNDIVKDLVISENTDINIFDVKNVVEVWGKTFNLDKDGRFAEASDFKENNSDCVYTVTLNNYTETGYSNDMKLALLVNHDNTKDVTRININGLGEKIIYDKTTGKVIPANTFQKDSTYMFQYSSDISGFYYLGSYQIHAVAIMTNGNTDLYGGEEQRKLYFKNKYNTDNIVFIEDKDNKYCIENIGEIRKSLNGNNYANLESNSIAASYATAKLNQLCRRSTSLSLEMIIVPWLDVNQKIEYTPIGSDTPKTYITKSISGDLLSGTMTVNLIDFYATLDTEN